jgi:hypothetical protein
MRLLGLFVFLACGLALRAAGPDLDHVTVPPMKTSIYVGSVTLTPGVFERKGDTFSATYQAKVFPWFFWSESGTVSIQIPAADLLRVLAGQTVEFTGEGTNQKNKPRKITGRVQPADARSGKIKIRIGADGTELIFNGTYRFGEKQD